MDHQLPNIISYFRDCYQTDFRTITLLDFFSAKVAKPLLLKSAELLEGKLLQFPVDSDWGQTVEKELAIYGKEKSLCACSFMVVGSTYVLGRKKNICAPLYIHPVQVLQENEVYYLQIEADNPTINPAIISLFQDTESGLYESLCAALPKGFVHFDALHQIEEALATHLPLLRIDHLDDFPQLLDKKQLKRQQKNAIAATNFRLLPSIGLGLLQKPSGSRGILNELEQIARDNSLALPLQELWQKSDTVLNTTAPEQLAIPVILSAAQHQILQNAFQYPLSLVIGPPGTGKSFTIAALALEYMSQRKSVLIAAKNIQAINVVGNKIEKDFGLSNLVVRAGSKDYKKELQKRLGDLLSGIGVRPTTHSSVAKLSQKVKSISEDIQQLYQQLAKRTEVELEYSGFLFEHKPYFWNRWKKKWMAKKVAKQRPYWELMQALENALQQRNQLLQKWLETSFHYYLHDTLCYHRKPLQVLLKGLKARTGNSKERYFDNVDFDKVLQALPIWISDTSHVHQVLPLQKELFDLVIIDEATQCDMASALPILQRGKQAVVVGDPKQLRHLSFLSKAQQNALIQKHQLGKLASEQLDYRNNSLLDLIAENRSSQHQIQFLDEHYRSMPDIIQFSNRAFYQNRLHIMTACPATSHRQHVFARPQKGERSTAGANPIEAEALLDQVAAVMKSEADLKAKLCQSIGILSPFRSQVNYLLEQAPERFTTSQMHRHNLLIGTPHSFQGEERDLMFLSFVLDDQSHSAAFRYLNREDVFNVSITRARSEQFIFFSFPPQKTKADSLLNRYLASIQNNEAYYPEPNADSIDDRFLEEVLSLLKKRNLEKVFKGYLIGGVEVDLVVVYQNKTYCIDLVGYPGAFEEALEVDRTQMLSRIGLPTFTLPYSWWVFEREKSENALLAFID